MLDLLTRKLRNAFLVGPLLLSAAVLPLVGQNYQGNDQRHDDRRGNSNYYNGQRDGGRGGNYDRERQNQYDSRNDDRYRNQHQGGIGPGKGALIGAGGGAVLGALFGGGAKGALIGGGVGAGAGALVGKVHQNNQRNDYRRDNY